MTGDSESRASGSGTFWRSCFGSYEMSHFPGIRLPNRIPVYHGDMLVRTPCKERRRCPTWELESSRPAGLWAGGLSYAWSAARASPLALDEVAPSGCGGLGSGARRCSSSRPRTTSPPRSRPSPGGVPDPRGSQRAGTRGSVHRVRVRACLRVLPLPGMDPDRPQRHGGDSPRRPHRLPPPRGVVGRPGELRCLTTAASTASSSSGQSVEWSRLVDGDEIGIGRYHLHVIDTVGLTGRRRASSRAERLSHSVEIDGSACRCGTIIRSCPSRDPPAPDLPLCLRLLAGARSRPRSGRGTSTSSTSASKRLELDLRPSPRPEIASR